MKNYRIRVYGKVQGVFFRASTLRVANEFGIKGWVRNEIDGSVVISADGEEKQLNRLLEWCKNGPDYAKVSRVDYREDELSQFNNFQILR